METFGGVPDDAKGKTFIVVEATNTGDRPTTITHLAGYYYKSRSQQLRKKPEKEFFVIVPALADAQPLPHQLGPGGRWLGGIEQNDELVERSQTGLLYCGIIHTSSKKPVRQRVVIEKNSS